MDEEKSALDIINSVADEGTFSQGEMPVVKPDPIGWVDREPYSQRLDNTRQATGLVCGVLWGRAEVGGEKVVFIASDFRFWAGSLGTFEAAAVCRAMETAGEEKVPAIWLARSGGARIQEGTYSLLGLAHIIRARSRLAECQIPFITIAMHPVFAGPSICVSQADILLGEENALFGFTGPKIIEAVTNAPPPPGFQTVESGFANGQLDGVVATDELRSTLIRVVRTVTPQEQHGKTSTPPAPPATPQTSILTTHSCPESPVLFPLLGERGRGEGAHFAGDHPTFRAGQNTRDPWACVQSSRTGNPTVRALVFEMTDSFFELHGDRINRDDPAVFGGIARINGTRAVIIGYDSSKASDTARNAAHNYAMPLPSGFRKALRLVQIAERLRLPILTLIDTPGVCPTTRCETEGVAEILGRLIATMLQVPVPTVGVILGEGASAAALPFATTDRLIMTDASWYSIISPEGAASIAWKDVAKTPDAAKALKLGPHDMLEQGIADFVIAKEPEGSSFASNLKTLILSCFREVAQTPAPEKRLRVAL